MNLVEKIENLINGLLLKLGGLLLALLSRLAPSSLKNFLRKFQELNARFKIFIKQSPFLLKDLVIKKIGELKTTAQSLDYKAKLISSYQNALNQYRVSSEGKAGKIRTIILTPFLVFGQWLQGLTLTQSMLLTTATAASLVAVVGVVYSGQRLISENKPVERAPASVEVAYERPEYYKEQNRQLIFTNVRLPVYIPQVNELRSVDIDFSLTLSNRESRANLSKKEFELRDHLILEMEPVIASFPLEEEGKSVIKEKIFREVNIFMQDHKIEGEVSEVEITYILAN